MKPDRLPVSSTRMNLQSLDMKLKGAERGYTLLKYKSDALQIRFKELESQLGFQKERLEMLFEQSFTLLNEAKFEECSIETLMVYCQRNPVVLKAKCEIINGLEIQKYEVKRANEGSMEIYLKGKEKLQIIKKSFDEYFGLLIEICVAQKIYDGLKKQLEETNKRKNSLEHSFIPKYKCTVKYIEDEMDELEREEFYRLKKIQTKKLQPGI